MSEINKLAQLISMYAPHDGRFNLSIPGVYAARFSMPNSELVHTIQKPGMCIVAQGAKAVMLGQTTYECNNSGILVYSVGVPVAARVAKATPTEPYLSLTLDISPQQLAELVLKVYPRGLPRASEVSAVYVEQRNPHLINAAIRLMELMAQSGERDLLAPLVMDEILIRLLRSPLGASVAQVGIPESGANKVAKAISWLQDNFAEPMKVEALAEMVHMSTSSFHQHFKEVTSMSPLQFQKVLRLQEAQRLILSEMVDVNATSLRVGYLSVSQFSREYSRYFGNSPTKDKGKLRQAPTTLAGQVSNLG
jgi:AraC-like DNA-binding protein